MNRIIALFREFPILVYLAFVLGLANGFALPLIKQINSSVTSSYFILALSEGMFIFFFAFMGEAWGVIFDTTSRKEEILFGILVSISILMLLTSLAGTPLQYLVSRVLTGIFLGSIYAYSMILIGTHYDAGERITIFMYFALGVSIISSIGTGLTYILSRFGALSWREILRIFSSIILAFSFLPLKNRLDIQGNLYPTKRFLIEETRNLFSKKTNVYVSLQAIFGCIPWGALQLFFIYAVMETYNCDFLFASIIVGLSGLGAFLSPTLVGQLDKLRLKNRFSVLAQVNGAVIIIQTVIFISAWLETSTADHGYMKAENIESLLKIGKLLNMQATIFIVTLNLFFFTAAFSGPITRNIIADTNTKQNMGGALMLIWMFEYIGKSLGIIIAGYLIDITKTFVLPIKLLALSWLISGIIWMTKIKKYYPQEIE